MKTETLTPTQIREEIRKITEHLRKKKIISPISQENIPTAPPESVET